MALANGGVNARLLDCSDPHRFSSSEHRDRIGTSSTWVKADPTFQELLQLAIEFDERHFVGDTPPLTPMRESLLRCLELICEAVLDRHQRTNQFTLLRIRL